MIQYKLLLIGFCLSFISCESPKQDSTDSAPQKPNIVYIMADDMGYGDLGTYNQDSKIETPHINQLASEGMKFTDMHSPSSVCTPTRYGIITGRYCWRSRLPRGVLRGYGRALIQQERKTVADLLKSQGYRTGVVGKWHLGVDWVIKKGHEAALVDAEGTQINEFGMISEMDPTHIDFTQKPIDGPLNHGFDYSFVLPASLDMDPYCYLENDKLTALPTEYTPGNDLNTGYTGAFWRAGLISPGFEIGGVLPTFAEKAQNFIAESAKNSEPFFLYLPLAAPHTPWMPDSDFEGKSAAGQYGDFVQMVDAAVGQVLAQLEKSGVKENTLVIFTSDNGPFWTPALVEKFSHKSVGELRGMKADAWEGGHRIPFIARWPGKIKAGSQSSATSTLTNFMATCADILDLNLADNEGEDSHSILPILNGEAQAVEGQEAVIHHSSKNYFAVRKGDWKLILGLGSGGFSKPSIIEAKPGDVSGQLYNLKEDIAETENVYASHPEVVKELEEILIRYKETGRSR